MEQNVSTTNDLPVITFDMMTAMCHNNRGIGYQGDLPWPKLKADFEYYLKTTSTHKKAPFSKNTARIAQRIKTHPNLLTVAGSVPEALEHIAELDRKGNVDSVWIMGGAGIYQCLSHPLCGRIYLTHVYKDFPSETFFPPFDDNFREVK
ncbi:hypothetical protein DPMN_028699 [Dreissena polymorpha]|uniref:dihydrofolate reductase n=1 Tax=Dreissena polymorpha TaxID=45954 RepID=A0A9D4LV65_DREPO|nr:hypothetical protein DPMN_028699 [Dreissena polymorpha]